MFTLIYLGKFSILTNIFKQMGSKYQLPTREWEEFGWLPFKPQYLLTVTKEPVVHWTSGPFRSDKRTTLRKCIIQKPSRWFQQLPRGRPGKECTSCHVFFRLKVSWCTNPHETLCNCDFQFENNEAFNIVDVSISFITMIIIIIFPSKFLNTYYMYISCVWQRNPTPSSHRRAQLRSNLASHLIFMKQPATQRRVSLILTLGPPPQPYNSG